ncbi:MAG TPA: hypothetical protein VMT29_07115 [Steroidobacteraceae bacterium]|nr:hypothetical protein [Steroidobacteraceae bacterium]
MRDAARDVAERQEPLGVKPPGVRLVAGRDGQHGPRALAIARVGIRCRGERLSKVTGIFVALAG